MRASLRAVYGITLTRHGASEPLTFIADCMMWLPPGAALWISMGGPAALTVEQREIRRVRFAIDVLDWHMHKGQKPSLPEDPPYAHEKRAHQSAMSRKYAAMQKRQRRQ